MVSSITRAASVSAPRVRLSGDRAEAAYRARLVLTDVVVVVGTVFASQWVWLGEGRVAVIGRLDSVAISYTLVSVALCALWLLLLQIDGTRGRRAVGIGATEYRLTAAATFQAFGVVAIVSYLLQFDVSRGYVMLAFPVGLVALLLSRMMWRRWLWAQRARGEFCARVLLVGPAEASLKVASDLSRQPEAGYRVVGACTPDGGSGRLGDSDIPLFGDTDRIEQALELTGADTVMVSSSERLPAQRVRQISWSLEAGRQHLVVAPSLTDIGGPRLHTRPVAGLPLLHVETPRYSGRAWILKRAFDLAGASALLVLLSPLFAVIALLVRASGPGPVFYTQERIGLRGAEFRMVKFRSMRVGADAELASLLAAQGTADRPLFKVDDDPRITPIGRILRKYSLDELPQLFNVVAGSMSLVGPRPQRHGEVELYDAAARRRLIAKPGMSGLWQVSGRSSLSWEDTIRLDLYYVENWSLAGDIAILFKTARAVVAPGGTAH